MPAFDEERIAIANRVRQQLAIENTLSRDQARAYVRCLQTTWQVPPIQWSERDSRTQLGDARRLIQAAHIYRQVEGTTSVRAIECYRRAGELLEWLARANDHVHDETPIELLAAAAFQLGGLPAMASGLLSQIETTLDGVSLYASFLRADFDAVLQAASSFWAKYPDLTSRDASIRMLSNEADPDRLGWHLTVELVRSLGLTSHSLRTGNIDRLERALVKLAALDLAAARTFSEDASLLISLMHSVARSYSDASIYRPIRRLAALRTEQTPRLLNFAREQYSRGRGILWTSQRNGLDRLIHESSFALCTPTGSGKTLVANMALVKELLLRDHVVRTTSVATATMNSNENRKRCCPQRPRCTALITAVSGRAG